MSAGLHKVRTDAAEKAEIIDRAGALYWQMKRLKAEFGPLEDEILGWYAAHPAKLPATAEGYRYSAQLTPRGKKRKITNKWRAFGLLRKLIGLKAAVEAITIPLEAAIDKYLPEASHASFLKEEQTGARTVTFPPTAEEAA